MATKRKKLISKKRLLGTSGLDSVKVRQAEGRKKDLHLLMDAQQCWENLSQFRLNRERCKRYLYGDQWDDVIVVDGVRKKEKDYIMEQGNIPMKNNLIRRTVRNVVGIFRKSAKEPTCVARDRKEQALGEAMSTLLQYNNQLNKMQEVHARNIEEFSTGGLIALRHGFGWRGDKCDCWTDWVPPSNLIIDNNMRDIRGWDVSLIGELHDVSLDTLCNRFAECPSDVEWLKELYNKAGHKATFANNWHQFGQKAAIDLSFFVPTDETRCRVIEVWRKETKPRFQCHDVLTGEYYKIEVEDFDELVELENNHRLTQGREEGLSEDDIPLIEARWFMDEYWYYYYLTPFGDILAEGPTPYMHGSHPYVFKAYPFIDGEIHPFVEDFIDQQRYINRMVTLFEWSIRASAKGVLLVPEDCIPDDSSLEEFAESWTKFNSVVAIKTKPGVPLPQQIASNSTNIGIMEMLNLQTKFFEDISGVNAAMQGKPGFSGMSASLYAQQTQNATTSLIDLLETYSSFVVDSAYKIVKNIQQFYDENRILQITGETGVALSERMLGIRDTEFDLSVIESTSTPVYRQYANEFLMDVWKSGQITLEQMLETGDFPFADKLLQSIQSQATKMQEGQNIQMDAGLLQQMQNGADMAAVEQARQMMMK